ncbi:MAG: KTSC domain-containing protein [Xanthobacteraceae bacterium]|jgi:hypothetical protein
MVKRTHHDNYSFPDHSAGVRSIGQPVRAPAALEDRAKFYADLKADKQGTTARVAANRANALSKPPSKKPGSNTGAYDFDLDSTCLEGGTYDPKTGELSLDFVKGGTWDYNVSRSTVQQLRTAASAGEFFNDEIRD